MVVCVVVALVIVIFAASELFVKEGFNAVEDTKAMQDTDKVAYILASDMNMLHSITREWAHRTDLVTYLAAPPGDGPPFISDAAFEQVGVNFIVLTTSTGSIIEGRSFDTAKQTAGPMSVALRSHLDSIYSFPHFAITDEQVLGILMLSGTPYMGSSQQVLSDDGKLLGTISMGRVFDGQEVARLESLSLFPITILTYQELAAIANPDLAAGYGEKPFLNWHGSDLLGVNSPVVLTAPTKETMEGYVFVNDLYGDPAVILKVEMPRDISLQGEKTTTYFMGWIIITGLVFGVILLGLLHIFVFSRLSTFSWRMEEIGDERDFSARVPEDGDDEITSLSRACNTMLRELETSQNQLRGRLTETEERYRLFFNSGKDVVLANRLGSEDDGKGKANAFLGTFIEVNDAAISSLGYSREEFLTMRPSEIMVPTEKSSMAERISRLQAAGTLLYVTELVAADGTKTPYEVSAHIFQNEGEPAVLSIARDITERRSIERLKGEAFAQIEQNMVQFAILNDHLRNPLQAIVGLALLNIEDEDVVNKILSQADLIDSYVDQLDRGWIESEQIRDWLRKYYEFK